MKASLVRLVALRFVRTRRRSGGSPSALLSLAGVGIGVMTLTVVLGVMNGFQLGFIESIVEIGSYHLQVSGPGAAARPVAELLRGVAGVRAAVPFVDRQALVQGPFSRPRPCLLRSVPADLADRDPAQARQLRIVEGALSLADPSTVVIGAELSAWLGARVGDTVSFTWLSRDPAGLPSPRRAVLRVAGVFRCGYYDYDAGLALVGPRPVEEAGVFAVTWGIKLADRFADRLALPAVTAALAGTGLRAESWRSYNRTFFDALMVEKLLMLLLVGLIFVVVGFNTYHSLRRAVIARGEEIAVLKAVGVPPRLVRSVFVVEGLVIGVAGALAGTAAGLALAGNINTVFAAVEAAVNGLAAAAGAGGGFAIFSPTTFYLLEVPSRVLAREAFLVSFLAVASCAAAAGAASRAVARFLPAEVLRHE